MGVLAYIMDGPYRGAVVEAATTESLLLPHPTRPSCMLRYSLMSGFCLNLVGVSAKPKGTLIVGRIVRPRPTTVHELTRYLLENRHVFITDPILGRRRSTYLGVYDGRMIFLNGISYPLEARDSEDRFTIAFDDAGFTLSDDRDSIRFDYLDWS